jgi:acyl-CoA synthetase (AMP-forming)/AMP-acid ligase II
VTAATASTHPSSRSVRAAFDDAVRQNPRGDFLHVPAESTREWADGPVTLTYTEAELRVTALEETYRHAGFVHGHRVALALDNRPDFLLHLLALNGLGVSVVPLNAGMAGQELRYILGHADVAAVTSLPEHTSHVRDAMPPGTALSIVGDTLQAPACEPRASRDEAALVYTSGTTGKPKGCILTNEYFLGCGELYTGLGGYCSLRPGLERMQTPLPLTHINALCCSFTAVLLGAQCLVQLDRFHPSNWWRNLRSSRATCFHYLGVMPAMLLSATPEPDDDISGQVRFAFGAGVDPRHHAPFEARFGVPLIEAWAMTETGGGAWITANHEPRHVGTRCFGRAPPGLEWRIVTDKGRPADPGEPGELWVRREGPDPRAKFFGGYYKDDAATAAAWAEGWFHTGDVVRVGHDG